MDHRLIRVLIVDDDRKVVECIRTALGDTGSIEVKCARNLHDAMVIVQAGGIDAVLMDVSLPDTCGVEGIQAVARTRIPVVAITGLGPDLRDEALLAGAVEFVEKPPVLAILVRILRHAVIAREVCTAFGPLQEAIDSTDRAGVEVDKALERVDLAKKIFVDTPSPEGEK